MAYLHVYSSPSEETVLVCQHSDQYLSAQTLGNAIRSGLIATMSRSHLNLLFKDIRSKHRVWEDIIIHPA